MTRPLLTAKNLVCHHGLLAALRGVSLTLEQGEVLSVIGANGAGKTTLMRTLAGAHRPTEGYILFNHNDVTLMPTYERVKAGIAMSPEGRRLFPDLTVKENLQIASENGQRGAWSLDSALDAFPQLVPLLDKEAGGLSGGQRQAAAIARALLSNPKLLILDEVSLGLSPVAVEGVYTSLEDIRDSRTMAMVVVEQDLNRALSFADKMMCISEGVVELAGKPTDFTRDQITAAYFGIHEETPKIDKEPAHV